MKNLVVYVAGPYSKGDVAINVRQAMKVADEIIDYYGSLNRVYVVVPHLTHFQHLLNPRPYEFWIDYDRIIIERCDALYLLRGTSEGAFGEARYAELLNIPVFTKMEDLLKWISVHVADTL